MRLDRSHSVARSQTLGYLDSRSSHSHCIHLAVHIRHSHLRSSPAGSRHHSHAGVKGARDYAAHWSTGPEEEEVCFLAEGRPWYR